MLDIMINVRIFFGNFRIIWYMKLFLIGIIIGANLSLVVISLLKSSKKN